MNYQQQTWNYRQSNTENISFDFYATRSLFLLSGSLNLQGQRTGDGTWQIARSNQLTGFESQDFVVLGGVRAVSESARSRCCPSGNAPKGSRYFQGKPSIDAFDGSKSNSCSSKRVNNQKLAVLNVSTWNYIAEPNKTKGETYPKQCSVKILRAIKNRLASSQCSKQQRSYRYEVAGSGTLTHSQFDSLKGPIG